MTTSSMIHHALEVMTAHKIWSGVCLFAQRFHPIVVIKFLWIFRYIALPSLTVTCIQAGLQYITEWDDFVYFVWIKWFTMAAITFYINLTRSDEIYFYHNIGISATRFYIIMTSIDFLIFCISMFIVIGIR